MRLLIIVDSIKERKSLEHLLISNGFDNFHSIHPSDELQIYLEKIVYKFVIILSKTLSKLEVENLTTKFSKATTVISIINNPCLSNDIGAIPIPNNYKVELIKYLKSEDTTDRVPKEDILIKINDKYKRIRLEDIEFIKADGKYVSLHLNKRKFSIRSTLKGISLMLPNCFVRTHSSFIVNLNKIESINIVEQNIELLNANIPFSRKYKLKLFERFHLG